MDAGGVPTPQFKRGDVGIQEMYSPTFTSEDVTDSE
jgi:hypothetical protein